MTVMSILCHFHVCFVIYFSGAKAASAQPASGEKKFCKLLLIHGGMDTQGEIFDDCLVYRLDE